MTDEYLTVAHWADRAQAAEKQASYWRNRATLAESRLAILEATHADCCHILEACS